MTHPNPREAQKVVRLPIAPPCAETPEGNFWRGCCFALIFAAPIWAAVVWAVTS